MSATAPKAANMHPNPNNLNAETNTEEIQTAKWTQYLPETFGIRQAIQSSKYRWCAREAGMWGIATGTAMALHRMRMGSRTGFAIHMGFASLMVVNVGSYVFCVKRRNYQEDMIQKLMARNEFLDMADMPEEVPLDENHPFLQPGAGLPEKQYVLNLPERKEWQPPLPTQDAAQAFQLQDAPGAGKR